MSRGSVVGVAALVGLTLFSFGQRRASASRIPLDPSMMRSLFAPVSTNGAAVAEARTRLASSGMQLQARPVAYILAVNNGSLFDMDGSGTNTIGDLATLEGQVLGANNIVLGSWEANLTQTSGNSIGVVGIRFSGIGSITLAGGSAVSDGIRSGVNCRAICGGTGGYKGLKGNAGFGLDGNNLIVIFNVK